MHIVCSDLEGVFVPEIWINVSKKTGIEELKLTTRDISDYDVLMKKRLGILKEHGLKLKDIQDVIATMDPLPGALEFINWMRARTQVIVVSDTFVQFAGPLMEKLGYPTLFCNTLEDRRRQQRGRLQASAEGRQEKDGPGPENPGLPNRGHGRFVQRHHHDPGGRQRRLVPAPPERDRRLPGPSRDRILRSRSRKSWNRHSRPGNCKLGSYFGNALAASSGPPAFQRFALECIPGRFASDCSAEAWPKQEQTPNCRLGSRLAAVPLTGPSPSCSGLKRGKKQAQKKP